METLTFNLVTPQETAFSGPATLVEAPGTLGDFGVLPGHMAFVSTLRPGVVSVRDEKDEVWRIFVAGGLAEVAPGGQSCTILAEHVTDLGKITRPEADAKLVQAKLALENSFDEDARLQALRELSIAEAILASLDVKA
jgi:F-type H+-transporting ATPase subunit epsilon